VTLLSGGPPATEPITYTDAAGTVIEDFERADPLAAYSGEVSGWTANTSGAIEGETSVEGTAQFAPIATSQVSTPRGNEYTVRVKLDNDSYPHVLTNVQSASSPLDDAYEFRIGPAYDKIEIHERSAGSRTRLVSNGYNFGGGASGTGGDGGGGFHLGCQVGDKQLRLRLYDADMNLLSETEAVTPNTQLSGGVFGVDSGDNPGLVLDRVSQQPLATEPGTTILDDFSHNDATRYDGDTAGWDIANSEASATDTYREIASDQVPTSRGEEYLVDVTFPSTGNYHKVYTNVQNAADPRADSYEVVLSTGTGVITLYERVGGTETYLGETSSSITKNTGTQYTVGVETSSDRVQVNFYDADMNRLGSSDPFATTAHSGGYAGFGSGDAASMIVDNIRSRDSSLGSSAGGGGGVPSDLSGTYSLSYEDDFDGSGSGVSGVAGLDGNSWELGYGWGTTSNNHDGEVRAENVTINNSNLILEVTDDHPDSGMYYTGAIASHNNRTFAPEDAPDGAIYMEARIKNPDLPGTLNAWWSKLESQYAGEWPPEIDFYEVVLYNPPESDAGEESTHHIHYNSSTNCGEDGTHVDHSNGQYTLSSGDFQDDFHVFGCLWDRKNGVVAHYVDGNRVGATSDSTINDSLNNCTPFYQMFVMQPGHSWPGDPPSDFSGYDTTLECDWVREHRRQ
jgi:hypothetical protein